MLEEFKSRNQVAYERYDSLTKQEQKIIDRWQALEYRLNPPAALLTGNQNNKLFGRNDPYEIIDTRQAVGYDKGKEGRGNEQSPAEYSWAQPNQTKPGTPNAYAEYLAYKEKVQARQQRLALEQALQELVERVYAGPQAFAYNGADGLTSGAYETGDATGSGGSGRVDDNYGVGDSFKPGGLDSDTGADSAFPAAGTGEATGQILSEGGSGAFIVKNIQGSGKVGDFTNVKGKPLEDIISRVPKDADMRILQPVPGKVQRGVEFYWKVNGKTMRVRIHDIDLSAPVGSNAANGWIVRIQEGKKYMDPDTGVFQPPGISNPDSPFYDPDLGNSTHIPIQTPSEEIINELIGNN